MTRLHRLPWTRFGAERRRDLPRVAAAASWLLGPAAWTTIVRSRFGDARGAEARWARRAVRRLGIRLQLVGLDNLDPSQRYVLAPLHEGFADAVALLHLPLRLRFVARAELVDWPVLGAALTAGGHVVVDPEQPVSAYRTLLRAAASSGSDSIVVFPQGTILGIESAFTAGAFHLAEQLGRPLLPIAISGSHRVWEHPFSPVVRFGQTIRLEVLPSIAPTRAVAEARDVERRLKRLALESTPRPRRYEPRRDGWWDEYRFEIDPDFGDVADQVAAHRRQVART